MNAAENEIEWKSAEGRNSFVQKIELILKQYGNSTGKTATEMEEHCFNKSNDKQSYCTKISKLMHYLKQKSTSEAQKMQASNFSLGQNNLSNVQAKAQAFQNMVINQQQKQHTDNFSFNNLNVNPNNYQNFASQNLNSPMLQNNNNMTYPMNQNYPFFGNYQMNSQNMMNPNMNNILNNTNMNMMQNQQFSNQQFVNQSQMSQFQAGMPNAMQNQNSMINMNPLLISPMANQNYFNKQQQMYLQQNQSNYDTGFNQMIQPNLAQNQSMFTGLNNVTKPMTPNNQALFKMNQKMNDIPMNVLNASPSPFSNVPNKMAVSDIKSAPSSVPPSGMSDEASSKIKNIETNDKSSKEMQIALNKEIARLQYLVQPLKTLIHMTENQKEQASSVNNFKQVLRALTDQDSHSILPLHFLKNFETTMKRLQIHHPKLFEKPSTETKISNSPSKQSVQPKSIEQPPNTSTTSSTIPVTPQYQTQQPEKSPKAATPKPNTKISNEELMLKIKQSINSENLRNVSDCINTDLLRFELKNEDFWNSMASLRLRNNNQNNSDTSSKLTPAITFSVVQNEIIDLPENMDATLTLNEDSTMVLVCKKVEYQEEEFSKLSLIIEVPVTYPESPVTWNFEPQDTASNNAMLMHLKGEETNSISISTVVQAWQKVPCQMVLSDTTKKYIL